MTEQRNPDRSEVLDTGQRSDSRARLERALREEALLTRGARALLAAATFEESARELFECAKEATGATAGYVALLSADGAENEVVFLDAGGRECTVDESLPMPIRGLRSVAYETNRVQYDNDFWQSEWTKFLPEGHVKMENVMFAPMVHGDKTVGLIGLANKEGDFTDEDAVLAEAFASMAALVLKNSRDRDLLISSESRLRALWNVASLVDPAVRELYDVVLREIVKMSGSRYGFVGQLREDETIMRIHAWSPEAMDDCKITDKPIDYPIAAAGLWAEALRQRGPILVNDMTRPHPGKKGIPEGHVPIENMLSLPVFRGNQVVAIAAVANKPGGYGDEDITQMDSFLKHVQVFMEKVHAEESAEALAARLTRAERMESLGVLAGGVAHDLNNLLGPLVVLTELLEEELDEVAPLLPGNGKEMLESLGIMKTSATRAAAVVRDLVVLGRRGQAEFKQLDLNDAINSIMSSPQVDDLREKWSHVEVALKCVDERLMVEGSEVHLVRILYNIIKNAFEAMEDAGSIRVHSFVCCLDKEYQGYELVPAGRYAAVEIADSGSGIDHDSLQRIIEPFFTRKVKSEKSGSGLGLSVVHGLVKDHSGYLDVTSEPGQGSRFVVYFPLTDAEVTTRPVEKAAPIGEENVLVVDDEAGQRYTLRRSLRALGYKVTDMAAGSEAIAELRQRQRAGETDSPYDLVILDMVLGEELDGLDVYRKILDLYPGQKVVVASGYASSERIQAARDLGAGWLAKPFGRDDLAAVVRSTLDA